MAWGGRVHSREPVVGWRLGSYRTVGAVGEETAHKQSRPKSSLAWPSKCILSRAAALPCSVQAAPPNTALITCPPYLAL